MTYNVAKRLIILNFSFFIFHSGLALAAEPYFVTIEKLELKKVAGDWVTVVEPDHRVDLMSTEASVTFFNNGRVPPGDYENFRVYLDDQGTSRVITRLQVYAPSIPVKKGSFINVWFILHFELNSNGSPVRPKGVKELRLTVDDTLHIDNDANLQM